MIFTEEDLRAVLADQSAAVPATPDLTATAARQGRSVRRRRVATATALTACAVAAITVSTNADPGPGRPARPPVLASPGSTQPDQPPTILSTPEIKAALRSVAQITGTASQCQRRIKGSGFVYAPERMLTTAHTVAGTRGSVQVRFLGSRTYSAQVVLFDPRRDIAVLRVPGLKTHPLRFDHTAGVHDQVIVTGFLRESAQPAAAAGAVDNLVQAVVPGRIRAEQRAKGPDIYHLGSVERQIYAVRAQVQPGVSGGPLLSSDGTVYGMIFAAALDDAAVGYALTADEIASDAEDGQTATRPVSTQSCSL